MKQAKIQKRKNIIMTSVILIFIITNIFTMVEGGHTNPILSTNDVELRIDH